MIRATRVLKEEGNLIYLEGHPYPHKGRQTIESVDMVNSIKKIWPFLVFKSVRKLTEHALVTYQIELCAMAAEIYKISHIFAYLMEYDGAYKFRVQDLANETSTELLTTRPLKEIRRLLAINKERDYPAVHRKFVIAATLLYLYVLFKRKDFIKKIKKLDWSKIQMDENDRYWASIKTDYEYGDIT